jgi:methionyl-tRNA synthetase
MLRAVAEKTVSVYREAMGRLDFVTALDALWDFVVRSNQYVEETAPWKLAKDPANARQLDGVLYNLAESTRLISLLVTPFMPTIAQQIRAQLGVAEELQLFAEEIAWGRLAPGTKIGQIAPLFPKRT